MPGTPVQRLERFLAGMAERGVTPGGVAVIACDGEVTWEHAFGLRALVPEPEPATTDTIYDLASLTKPLITAALWLAHRDRFGEPVDVLVDEMRPRAGEPRAPTIGELLLHASGLPSWKPLYAITSGDMASRAEWLARHRAEPGRRAAYGCPGYQVLGLALERLHGAPLRELARRAVAGVDGAHVGGVAPELLARTAPTEEGNAREAAMLADEEDHDLREYAGFRTSIIRGATHDHCAFTAGGFAGNAGLFATARATAELASRALRSPHAAELSRDLAPHLEEGGEMRSWGWQLARSANSPAGEALSDRAFGHSGFTGTSVFVEPDRGAVFVLLTNRIHPRVGDVAFHAERRRFHDAAVAALDELRG